VRYMQYAIERYNERQDTAIRRSCKADGRRPKQCVENCGRTARDSNMDTIDSLYELFTALSNGTIADPQQRTV